MFAFFKKRNVRLKRQQEYLDLIDEAPTYYEGPSHLPKEIRYLTAQIPERYMIFFCLLISVFIISVIIFLISIAKYNIFNKSDLLFGILTLMCVIGFATLYISSKISSTTNSALQKVWDTVNISETRLIGVSNNVDITLKLLKSVKTDINDIQIKIHSLNLKGLSLNEEDSTRLKDVTKSISLLEKSLEESMNDFLNEKKLSKSILSEQLGHIHGLNSKIFNELQEMKYLVDDLKRCKEYPILNEEDVTQEGVAQKLASCKQCIDFQYNIYDVEKRNAETSLKYLNLKTKLSDLKTEFTKKCDEVINLQKTIDKIYVDEEVLNRTAEELKVTQSQLKVLQTVLFEVKHDEEMGSHSSIDDFTKSGDRQTKIEEFYSSEKSLKSKASFEGLLLLPRPSSTLYLTSSSDSNPSETSKSKTSIKSAIVKVTNWIDSFAEKP